METLSIKLNKEELKTIIKESVREVLGIGIIKNKNIFLATPLVSQKEQKDIEKRYGKPTKKTSKAYQIEI